MIFSESLRSPDVDADADVGNEIWPCNGGCGVVGGTSLSCLLWVGFMADVNQIRTTNAPSPPVSSIPSFTAKSAARMAPLLITQGISMTSSRGTTTAAPAGKDWMSKRSSARS